MIVTEDSFPHGVRCHNCHQEIPPGEQYRNQEIAPDVDGVFCVTCRGQFIPLKEFLSRPNSDVVLPPL